MDWINVAQNSYQGWALMNTVIKLDVFLTVRHEFTIY